MATLQPGQMLGQYQITSQIGRGGMATVYKAYHASMDRYVALKVVSGQVMDDPNFLKRFAQEARVIAKLEHPHILPVHDFGEADGVPYMVMRFLEAGTLTEVLEAGQLSLPEVDRIFTQLTEALGYAHEQGVIHRDIKPSNAMLDKRGDIFLTDFGIAKIIEGSPRLTATGAITGTPSYMSPEQAQGNPVDQRSDIYSLGVVLFEMLTGRVPFEAETPMAVLFKQILDPPPPLSMVRADLPYTLEIVLLKAMSKKAEDRYPSMAAFRAAWKKALAEAADIAAPVATAVSTVSLGAPAAASTVQNATPAMPTAASMPVNVPVAEPARPAAPAKKGFNWKWLALGVVALLVVCVGAGGLFFASNFFRPKANLSPSDNKPLVIFGAKGTQSWAAANSVYSIAIRGDEVLAAGFGGITIWNRKSGSYKQITTAIGLPSANIGVIFVDTDNSLWVGTDAGLAHVEGDLLTALYTDKNGMDGNGVTGIVRSGKRLFVSTQYSGVVGGGLDEFNGSGWQHVANFPSSDKPDEKTVSYNVFDINADPAGNLWVATDSGIAMLDSSQQWTVFKTTSGLVNDKVLHVYINQAGNVFATTADGGVVKFNPDKKVFETYRTLKDHGAENPCCMAILPDGTEWYADYNVARYKPDTQEWTDFSDGAGTFPSYAIRAMAVDDAGTVYFGTEQNGLVRYINNKFETLQVPNTPHYGEFGNIVPAPEGKLFFIQKYSSGADEFDPPTGTWTKVPVYDSSQPIPRIVDANGRIWSGGVDGLWIFENEKATHITVDRGMPSNTVNAVAFGVDGTPYIATDAGIAVLDSKSAVKDVYTVAKNGLISDNVYSLFMASDGSLWASQDGGFSRRTPDGKWQSFTAEGLFQGYASYFANFVEDANGTIWIPTNGDGLYSFAKGKWSRIVSTDPGVGLPSDDLNAVALGADGVLWIGTNGAGVVRYDGKVWQAYSVKDGLLQATVNGIYIEPSGVVWLTTNGGITRLEP